MNNAIGRELKSTSLAGCELSHWREYSEQPRPQRSFILGFALPNYCDTPTKALKFRLIARVALYVGCKFRVPVFRTRFRN